MRNFYKNSEQPIPAIAFENSPPNGYVLITDPEVRMSHWKAKYRERKEDGQRYYTETQAALYIDLLNGIYTGLEVFEFEEHTSKLADQIFKGDWLTAQETCNNLATSGIFDTVKKAEIQTEIDTYVTNNY
jgi:hypothetical protein